MKVPENSAVMSQRQSVREVRSVPSGVLDTFPPLDLQGSMEFGKKRILAVFSLSDSSTSPVRHDDVNSSMFTGQIFQALDIIEDNQSWGTTTLVHVFPGRARPRPSGHDSRPARSLRSRANRDSALSPHKKQGFN